MTHSDSEWRAMLSAEQYEILREEGTERAYSSPLNNEHREGVFLPAPVVICRCFSSDTKFDSRTGWPSFWAPLDNAVATRQDRSFGVLREEVHCRRCGGHLGHVFRRRAKAHRSALLHERPGADFQATGVIHGHFLSLTSRRSTLCGFWSSLISVVC